jgi:hypothetical protein
MARPIRFFILMFVAFPAAFVWLLASTCAGLGFSAILVGQAKADGIMIPCACLGLGLAAHLIQIFASHVVDDPRYRLARNRVAARLGWDLAVDCIAIVMGGAGWTTIFCFIHASWFRAFIALLLFAGSAYVFVRLLFARRERLERWMRETPELPALPEPER